MRKQIESRCRCALHNPILKRQTKKHVASLKVGDVVMGTVRSVQSYGVFVTLDGSGISGLCHISMFADMHVKDDWPTMSELEKSSRQNYESRLRDE